MLGADSEMVARLYGVRSGGNATHDPTGELVGLNQFFLARTVGDVAAEMDTSVEMVGRSLDHARHRLLETRQDRPRPHLDDKVLAAWNGLMIGAAARAAHVMGEALSTALSMAEQVAAFCPGIALGRVSRHPASSLSAGAGLD